MFATARPKSLWQWTDQSFGLDPALELAQEPSEGQRGHDPDGVRDDQAVGARLGDATVEPLDEVERGADRVLRHEGDVEPGLPSPDAPSGRRRRGPPPGSS